VTTGWQAEAADELRALTGRADPAIQAEHAGHLRAMCSEGRTVFSVQRTQHHHSFVLVHDGVTVQDITYIVGYLTGRRVTTTSRAIHTFAPIAVVHELAAVLHDGNRHALLHQTI